MGADVDLRGGCGSSADFGLGHGQRPEAGPAGFEAAVFMTRWMFPHIGFMSLVALSSVSSTPGVDLPFRCDAGSAQSGDFAAWRAPFQIQGH
jgi:hypothetical protein